MSTRVGGIGIFDVLSASPTAVATKGLVYVRDDGHLYMRNSAGVESRVTGNEIVDTGWIASTLTNTWGNYGSGWATAAYRKIGNTVMCKGLINNGAPATAVMFNLPVGFRPTALQMFVCISSSSTPTTSTPSAGTAHTHTSPRTNTGVRIDVSTNGDVNMPDSTASSGFVSLNNVIFTID
jgi:hypothetical protein